MYLWHPHTQCPYAVRLTSAYVWWGAGRGWATPFSSLLSLPSSGLSRAVAGCIPAQPPRLQPQPVLHLRPNFRVCLPMPRSFCMHMRTLMDTFSYTFVLTVASLLFLHMHKSRRMCTGAEWVQREQAPDLPPCCSWRVSTVPIPPPCVPATWMIRTRTVSGEPMSVVWPPGHKAPSLGCNYRSAGLFAVSYISHFRSCPESRSQGQARTQMKGFGSCCSFKLGPSLGFISALGYRP